MYSDYNHVFGYTLLTHVHVQSGEVISSVIVVIAIIARSRVLDISAGANCHADVEISEKTRSGASRL